MMEAVQPPRLKARVLFVLAAMVVALMASSMMFNASGSLGGSLLGTKEADAAVSYRQIKGTVYRSDTQRAAPNAYVDLWKYTPNCVQSTCWTKVKSTQANAYGQYSFSNNRTGYKYVVRGWVYAGGQWYQTDTSSFYLRTDISTAAKVNVTVRMPSPF